VSLRGLTLVGRGAADAQSRAVPEDGVFKLASCSARRFGRSEGLRRRRELLGCVFTDVVKLPLANDTVTTMGKSTPPIENVPVMTI
jgi:hypothetical protein